MDTSKVGLTPENRQKIADVIRLGICSFLAPDRYDNPEGYLKIADKVYAKVISLLEPVELEELSDEEIYQLWQKYEREHPLQDINFDNVVFAETIQKNQKGQLFRVAPVMVSPELKEVEK